MRKSATSTPIASTAKGRRRAITVVAASLVTVLLAAGYVAADIVDLVPGLLTVSGVTVTTPLEAIPAATLVGTAKRNVPIDVAKANALINRFGAAEGVGAQYSFAIADDNGSVVAGHAVGAPREPASTLKTLTALAAASALDMGSTFSTSTMLDQSPAGVVTLTLKGGGDMLLGRGASDPAHVNGRAGLATLADESVQALRQRGIGSVRLTYDDTLFGAQRTPSNSAENNPDNLYFTPISAMAIDGGRTWPGSRRPKNPDTYESYPPLSTTTAADAARAFAGLLEDRGITIEGPVRSGTAPAGISPLASVHSAALGEVLGFALRHSDNTLAEEFGRLLALRADSHRGGVGGDGSGNTKSNSAKSDNGSQNSPAGAVAAVRRELEHLGIDLSSVTMADCSGLSPGSSISAATLAQVQARNLSAGAGAEAGEGLSMPGLVGTAIERLGDPDAAGLLRVKTGSLGHVTAIVGNVSRTNGGTLAFAIIVNGTDDAAAAKHAVDKAISAMIGL
ncbi:MAG: D-alanyl-D-alanine carboxypeptidase [Bifidobacterium sp.]|nr:D-alanyl-D-alanine carboxypeptidase [Bifidobacterium sp.]MCI1225511.1 D-alanyl-D-alanine carboxypeptidase [Bifidobacterium sp.]